jgi:hypothetical protein
MDAGPEAASILGLTALEANYWMTRLIDFRNKYGIPPPGV